MVTPSRVMSDYEKVVFGRWLNCELTNGKEDIVLAVSQLIKANQTRYATVSELSGVPWFIIGALHYRESSCSFTRHLHNGDPLTAKTVHVPSGRPLEGDPPFTWEESAVDALSSKFARDLIWDITSALTRMEGYNGFGYKNKGVPTPYVWSMTDKYTSGKYVADGKYDSTFVDGQAGCAAILKSLSINYGIPDSTFTLYPS